MERLKNESPTNRRRARSRTDASDAADITPEARRQRVIDRKVAAAVRAERRKARHDGLDLDLLQRQVARLGGSMRIVIEFPAPAEPRPHRRYGGPRRPRLV